MRYGVISLTNGGARRDFGAFVTCVPVLGHLAQPPLQFLASETFFFVLRQEQACKIEQHGQLRKPPVSPYWGRVALSVISRKIAYNVQRNDWYREVRNRRLSGDLVCFCF